MMTMKLKWNLIILASALCFDYPTIFCLKDSRNFDSASKRTMDSPLLNTTNDDDTAIGKINSSTPTIKNHNLIPVSSNVEKYSDSIYPLTKLILPQQSNQSQSYQANNRSSNQSDQKVIGTEPCQYNELTSRAGVMLCVLIGIIATGLAGNLLIVVVLYRSKKLVRHPANLFVGSLSACNAGMLLTCVPLKIHSALHDGNFCLPDEACSFYNLVDLVFHVSSVTHLLVVSVERFMAIKTPFYHRHRMTRRFTMKVLTGVWLYSVLWVAVSFVPWHHIENDQHPADGMVNYVARTQTGEIGRFCVLHNPNYALTLNVLGFILPIIIMTTLNVVTLQNIFRPTGTGKQGGGGVNSLMSGVDVSLFMKHGRKKEAALTKTLVFIYTAFVVCWLPAIVLVILKNVSLTRGQLNISDAVRTIFLVVMPTIPTCALPIIYVKHYGKFGEELRNMRSSRRKGLPSQKSF